MPKLFDASLNVLIDLRSGQWADCFARLTGAPPGKSSPLDTDLATTLQADRVFKISGQQEYLLHLELQANPRLGVPGELMRYNTVIDHQHSLPVETVLVLLRAKARASDITGRYERLGVTGRTISSFHYHVERVWERSIDFWLNQGVGLAPLALLTDDAAGDLGQALGQFEECLLDHETDETTRISLVGSSYILCGLRYHQTQIAESYRRFAMLLEDSTTYQEILQKGLSQGQTNGQKTTLLRQGNLKFGKPSSEILERLNRVNSPASLDQLADRILQTNSWEDFLAGI